MHLKNNENNSINVYEKKNCKIELNIFMYK